jgi:formylglycine-generating enzyme required for sulfatase activity
VTVEHETTTVAATPTSQEVQSSVDGEKKTITLPGGLELKLVKIEPGICRHPECGVGEITYQYWLGETEVTQGQYAAIMEGVMNEIGETCKPRPSKFTGDDCLPVEQVSWYDAKAFCYKLNRLFEEKLPQGYMFDLPTHEQWKYAAWGGKKSQEYKFCGGNDINAVAWYAGNSGRKTHPVGMKQANELGLFDMNGNVDEWCRQRPWKGSYDSLFADYEWRYVPGETYNTSAGNFDPWNRGGGCTTRHFYDEWRGFRIAVVPINPISSVSAESYHKKTEMDLKEINIKTISGFQKNRFEYKVLALPFNVELKLGKINPGSFMISKWDKKITLTREYWLGETEVTQGQYASIMDGEMNEKGKFCRLRPSYFNGDDKLPVESVSWYDAKAFCRKLNSLFEGKLPNGYQFDLPTEAQWEFAARGGNKSEGYIYSGSNNLDEVGWYNVNSGEKRLGEIEYKWYHKIILSNGCKTHPVGSKKKPNELGLYDMSGNVWEWCRDVYEKDFAKDPEFLQNQPVGSGGVLRGGGWNCKESNCSSVMRYHYDLADESGDLGFRVALVPVQ